MSKPVIECVSLSKQYKSRGRIIEALKNINLKVEKAEFILIKGRSGAGKSTLLYLIAGLIVPTSGTVRVDEQIINKLNNKSLSYLLLNKIGIIFQNYNLLPTYNVYENIEIALAPKNLSKKEIQKLVMPYFEQFHLSDKIDLLPEELSIGQQQKVAIIRTLVKQPSIILADEPTASVDYETAEEILKCLSNMRNEKGITVLLATHGIVPDNIADKMVMLEEGLLIN
ncbi:MAG TPA: ABC transporter ATP-binding protein [Bacteroidales bacterium]|nr:ABC transporter ATP-binding protein [Bacteroidales bacterium]HCI55803.1 hypothetical protein [Bacteroidales bacterium]HOU96221.1 ABC transporter ATP-binding protein [Bacteroidales bacterium]HQG37296.1 ABC transporter ATP-binding protein [Bacteroidales bacterium]HQG52044.1 ABC transporter ATP-binding protein [Bacteroidales bacterium]